MTESPPPSARPNKRHLQTDRAIAELRDAVLRLDVLPGSVLTERFIQDEFNVSRTPARAALAKLETEGLVERAGRGWKVTRIDAHDLTLISDFREVVESAAISRVIASASDEQLALLIASHDESSGVANSAVDGPAISLMEGERFHRDIADLSGNPYLVTALDSCLMLLSRSRWLVTRDALVRQEARESHQELVQALRNRDTDGAVDALQKHLRSTHKAVIAALNVFSKPHRTRGLDIVTDSLEITSSER